MLSTFIYLTIITRQAKKTLSLNPTTDLTVTGWASLEVVVVVASHVFDRRVKKNKK